MATPPWFPPVSSARFHPRTQASASPGPRVPRRRAHRAPKPPVAIGQLEASSTSRPPSREVGEAAAEEAVAPRSRPTSDNSRSPDEAGQAGEEVVTGASSPGSRHAPPAGLRCLRLDVLVHAEKVPRVVFTLDLDETVVVPSVAGPDPVLIVAG